VAKAVDKRSIRQDRPFVLPYKLNLLKMKRTLTYVGTVFASLAFAIPMIASASVVYNAIPDPLAPNYPSQPYQAQQTNEFGDYVHLGGTDRQLTTVTVTMSDWALASAPANIAFCESSSSNCDSAGFDWPITVNVYANSLTNDVPNTLLGTKTIATHIPWRPAEDSTNCPTKDSSGYPYKWQSTPGAPDTNCSNGFAFNATFDLSDLNLALPNDVIVGFVYNTQTYGPTPTGVDGPYNSLNIAVPANNPVLIGTDDSASEVFWNTETESYYSNENCPSNTFCKDTNWSPYGTVAMQINAITPAPSTVTVTIEKYIDGVHATASNANSLAFPMLATWSATNIGSGSGSYDLDSDGFNGIPTPYQAITSEMTAGADYSTYEITSGNNVGASCADGKPFALVGYTTGNTLIAAAGATLSTTIPSLTNLQSNKYVIVWNQTCVPPPSCPAGTTQSSVIETVTVPATSSTDTLSINTLANGTNYLLKAYGTADAGDGITFDARYSFRTSSSVVWTDAVSTYESYGTQLLDLLFNTSTPWGSYNSSHEYLALVAGNGAIGHFLISDVYNPNNSGEIKVDIHSCMPNIKYVTGGGNYKNGTGKTATAFWTFGGNVWTDTNGNPVGQFELVDHTTNTNYHFDTITSISGSGNTITFTATGTKQGKTKSPIAATTFTIVDNGEPGKTDSITISGGAALTATPISGGNFQVLIQ
jgi:hypothetical protein